MVKQAILCVDDEALILLAIKQELKSNFGSRFLYETALNADEAFEIIRELVSDGVQLILVITDWLMPGMKGDDFLRWIRSENPDVKTIMITGHATPDAVDRIKNEQLADFLLIKPWRSAELISLIEECLVQINPES